MDRRQLHVVISMDCERVTDESLIVGTESWDMGRRAVLGLAEMLETEGFQGTFLPTPDAATRQSALFREVEARGFEVGLHLHCRSFGNLRYDGVLGRYEAGVQRRILAEAKEAWEQALGRPAETFRSGYFSANDHTFPILAELGLLQTSCSKPGRYLPEVAACWLGALPYARRASGTCRLESGDLDLVEVPVSSHPGERFALKPSFDPTDPRPDSGHAPQVYDWLVDAALHEMALLAPRVATFVIITHNTIDYGDSEEPRRALLLGMLRHLRAKVDEGWIVVPATLASVRSAVLA